MSLLAEIYAQPDALRQTIAGVTPDIKAEFRWRIRQRTIITGMGSSHSVAYYAACLLAQRFSLDITAVETSELLDYQPGLLPGAALLAISQSGRSAEIVELLPRVRGSLVGLTNHAGSPLAQASDLTLLTCAGDERAASTKTYTAALALLLALCGIQAETLPEIVEHELPIWDEGVTSLAARCQGVQRVVLIGRGPSYASAMTGALLLQEAAKMPAQALSGGGFIHGPIEAFDHDTLYVVFAPTGRTQACSLKLAQKIRCLGGKVILLGGADSGIPESAISLPVLDEWRESLLNVIPMQLLAARLGMMRGRKSMDFATVKRSLNMHDHHYALVLAGGSGTRLWPLQHKPLLALCGEKSLFEQTIERLQDVVSRENVYVVTDDALYPILRDLAPDLRYVREPSPRDTAAAVGLGLLEIMRQNPGAVVAIVSSDHFIADTDKLRAALQMGYRWAEEGQIALLGAPPEFAATGYGYILHGAALGENVYGVERFIEKPSVAIAQQLIEVKGCSWDAGMLVVSAQVLLDEVARQQPQMLECLRDAARWREIAPISLDYAIMEGAQNRVVVRLETAWSDVGSWGAIYDALPKDLDGNVLSPHAVAVNTRGTLVRSVKPTAVIGLQDVIVVDTLEALLVCHRDQAQAVRQVAKRLRKSDESP